MEKYFYKVKFKWGNIMRETEGKILGRRVCKYKFGNCNSEYVFQQL